MRIVIILVLCALTVGCASTDDPARDTGEVPVDRADPGGDIGNSFNIGAPRTVREKKAAPSQFFFKECSANGNDTYYSKTSYYCN